MKKYTASSITVFYCFNKGPPGVVILLSLTGAIKTSHHRRFNKKQKLN